MNNLTNVKIVGWFLLINGILFTLGGATDNWGINLSATFGLYRSISIALICFCIYYGYCLLFDNSKIKEKIINKINLLGRSKIYAYLIVYIVLVFSLMPNYSLIKLDNGIVYAEMDNHFGYKSPEYISAAIWDIAIRYENSEEINLKINLKFDNAYGKQQEKTLRPFIFDAVEARKYTKQEYSAYDDWGIGASSGTGGILVVEHLASNGFTFSR